MANSTLLQIGFDGLHRFNRTMVILTSPSCSHHPECWPSDADSSTQLPRPVFRGRGEPERTSVVNDALWATGWNMSAGSSRRHEEAGSTATNALSENSLYGAGQ